MYFALEERHDTNEPSGIDLVVLVDESASIGEAQRSHTRDAVTALVGSLDPARDRVGLLRFGSVIERDPEGMRTPGPATATAYGSM